MRGLDPRIHQSSFDVFWKRIGCRVKPDNDERLSISTPRPFGAPGSDVPLFLVVIARDLEGAELDTVQPVGLFTFASWTEPLTVGRAGALQSAVVEWM